MKYEQALAAYERFIFNDERFSFPVYKKLAAKQASGKAAPAIVVMHEVPGIYPSVIDFSERLVANGFSVYMPSLLGEPGKPFSGAYTMSSMAKACIRKEFNVLAKGKASPITEALRALCRLASEQSEGQKVGAIGMCLTGNFALALAVDDVVMAPVLSQPSLPFPVSKAHKQDLHISDEQLSCLKERVAQDDLKILGLKFSGDPLCPNERFERLQNEFNEAFEPIVIDSSIGNKSKIPVAAHSVVTRDFLDHDGHPTQVAMRRVLAFFTETLQGQQ